MKKCVPLNKTQTMSKNQELKKLKERIEELNSLKTSTNDYC
jgi:hypothetical protein